MVRDIQAHFDETKRASYSGNKRRENDMRYHVMYQSNCSTPGYHAQANPGAPDIQFLLFLVVKLPSLWLTTRIKCPDLVALKFKFGHAVLSYKWPKKVEIM